MSKKYLVFYLWKKKATELSEQLGWGNVEITLDNGVPSIEDIRTIEKKVSANIGENVQVVISNMIELRG